GCLAKLGSLCLDASEAAVTIGTSGAVRVTLPKPLIDTERMIFSYLLDATTFVCGGAINNGGNVLQWLANKFLVGDAVVVEDLFAEAAKVPAGSDGLLFLPYLNGERAPIWDEKSSGVFFGIKTVHEQPHFARAAMEGICFALMEILSIIEGASGVLHKIKFSGAVAESMVMLQMLADVSGKEVVVHEEGDASALGAAYLALKDLGAIENYANIKAGASKTIQPDTANAAVYKKQFAIYRTLYPALKQAMHSVHLPTTT
ncbi:MAG TPA: FGGY-family carbohydrate kinase, partial [Flavisolibacter sp.]|nr:FGGY-family carbohydrate kinase [Flavisolibacter sp.]